MKACAMSAESSRSQLTGIFAASFGELGKCLLDVVIFRLLFFAATLAWFVVFEVSDAIFKGFLCHCVTATAGCD